MTSYTRLRYNSLLLALAAAAAGLATIASPAHAERLGLDDAADVGGASRSDVRAVSAIHGAKRLVTVVDFVDLERASDAGPSSVSVFFDTDRRAQGPEFVLATSLQDGTDHRLVRMLGWKAVGEPLTCRHAVRLDVEVDQVRLRVNRGCLGKPARVRIGVKMTDWSDASHPVVDWLGPRRYLSIAIASA